MQEAGGLTPRAATLWLLSFTQTAPACVTAVSGPQLRRALLRSTGSNSGGREETEPAGSPVPTSHGRWAEMFVPWVNICVCDCGGVVSEDGAVVLRAEPGEGPALPRNLPHSPRRTEAQRPPTWVGTAPAGHTLPFLQGPPATSVLSGATAPHPRSKSSAHALEHIALPTAGDVDCARLGGLQRSGRWWPEAMQAAFTTVPGGGGELIPLGCPRLWALRNPGQLSRTMPLLAGRVHMCLGPWAGPSGCEAQLHGCTGEQASRCQQSSALRSRARGHLRPLPRGSKGTAQTQTCFSTGRHGFFGSAVFMEQDEGDGGRGRGSPAGCPGRCSGRAGEAGSPLLPGPPCPCVCSWPQHWPRRQQEWFAAMSVGSLPRTLHVLLWGSCVPLVPASLCLPHTPGDRGRPCL